MWIPEPNFPACFSSVKALLPLEEPLEFHLIKYGRLQSAYLDPNGLFPRCNEQDGMNTMERQTGSARRSKSGSTCPDAAVKKELMKQRDTFLG